MCGYDPFYWYDRQLDTEYAQSFGFECLQDFYDYLEGEDDED